MEASCPGIGNVKIRLQGEIGGSKEFLLAANAQQIINNQFFREKVVMTIDNTENSACADILLKAVSADERINVHR